MIASIWIAGEDGRYYNKNEEAVLKQQKQEEEIQGLMYPKWKAAKDRIDALIKTGSQIKHNCPTWAGNSGGPVVSESNPEVAIGLPLDYAQFYRRLQTNDEALQIEAVSDFIGENERQLAELGVQINDRACVSNSMQ